MNRTTQTTRALATLWAGNIITDAEISILSIADEYREKLCAINQERHEKNIDLRNLLFPDLYAAMIDSEHWYARIWEIERDIKALHSEVRDRNIVTVEQEQLLETARENRKAAVARVKLLQREWFQVHKDFKAIWKDIADWKNVKSREKRKEMYAGIDLSNQPMAVAAYGRLWMEGDLKERELDAEYATRLHSAIRIEIKDASQHKTGKDKPGIRYQYGRKPQPKEWEKLSLQFSGGLSVEAALAGRNRQLRLTPLYTNHCDGGDETVYRVVQQIGTSEHPREVTYLLKAHVPLRGIIQRWSIVIRDGRRFVVPIMTGCDFGKPIGEGSFRFRLCWTRKKDGVEVAQFQGDHVNENLVIPNWIVEKRMCLKYEQASCDLRANEYLTERGETPQTGKRQGVDALEDYCAANPSNLAAANILANYKDQLGIALRKSQSAARCIEDIYKVVAYRICKLHSEVVESKLDLARLKKYDKRDLLKEDVVPLKSREILHAMAPGKLKAAINGYGLASVEVDAEDMCVTRNTDIFTTYVQNLGVKTGTKPNKNRRVSRMASGAVAAEELTATG